MKIKRLMGILLILTLVVTVFAGCSGKEEASSKEANWTVSVEGIGDEAISFTDISAQEISTKEIEAVMKKKDGSEQEQTWKGYGLKEVLDYLNAGEYTSVVVEAADGYSKELTKDLADSEGTILGVMVDGKALEEDDNRIQLVIKGKGSNWWIKGVAKIKVIK